MNIVSADQGGAKVLKATGAYLALFFGVPLVLILVAKLSLAVTEAFPVVGLVTQIAFGLLLILVIIGGILEGLERWKYAKLAARREREALLEKRAWAWAEEREKATGRSHPRMTADEWELVLRLTPESWQFMKDLTLEEWAELLKELKRRDELGPC